MISKALHAWQVPRQPVERPAERRRSPYVRYGKRLVSPWPLLVQCLERCTTQQMRRHDAKLGITGWAQLNGRNALTREQRFAFDVYADNVSCTLDLKTMALTAWKILRRGGINQPGHATAEEFKGSFNQAAS